MGQEVSKNKETNSTSTHDKKEDHVETKAGTITLHIEVGNEGGAPPHRKWHTTGSVKVEVDLDDSYAEMIAKIKKAIFISSEDPSNKQLSSSKTVRENGLKNGDKLQFWSGALD